MTPDKSYPVEEAMKAQTALREAAGLAPEQFPLQAFVGMISDEIELLRARGKTDEQIAAIIRGNSAIAITPAELAENYAAPGLRHPPGHGPAGPDR